MGDATCFCTLPIAGDDDAATLDSCSHSFHFVCISKWGNKVNTCPVCKRRFYEVRRISDGAIARFKDREATVEQAEEITCMYCGGGGDEARLLLCDGRGCANGAHTSCFGLEKVPRGRWFCTACVSRGNLEVENEDEEIAEEEEQEEPDTSSSSSAEEAEEEATVSVRNLSRTVSAAVRAEGRSRSTLEDLDSVLTDQSEDDSDSDYSLSERDGVNGTGRRRAEEESGVSRPASSRARVTSGRRASGRARRSRSRGKVRRKKGSRSRGSRRRGSRSRVPSKRVRSRGPRSAPGQGVSRNRSVMAGAGAGAGGSREEPDVDRLLRTSARLLGPGPAVAATSRSIGPRVLASAAAASNPRHPYRAGDNSLTEGEGDSGGEDVVQGSFRDAALAAELARVGRRNQSRELKARLCALRDSDGNNDIKANGNRNGKGSSSGSSGSEANAFTGDNPCAARPRAAGGARGMLGGVLPSSGLALLPTAQKSRSQRNIGEGSGATLQTTSKCRLDRVQITSLVERLESVAAKQRQLRSSMSVSWRPNSGSQVAQELSAEAKHALDELGRIVRLADRPSLEVLLACQVLPAMRRWLESVADGGALLPAGCPRRTSLLKVLKAFPVSKDYLRDSGIGKVVMAMVTSNLETAETKAMATQLIKRWSEPFRTQQPSETLSSSSSSSSLSSSMSSWSTSWSSSSSLTRSSPTAPSSIRSSLSVTGISSRAQLGAPFHGTLTSKPKPGDHGHKAEVVVATGANSRDAAAGISATAKREWLDQNPREPGVKRGVDVFMASLEGVTAGAHNAFGNPDSFSPKYGTSGYVIPKRSRLSGGVGDGGRSSTAAVSVPMAVVPSR